MACVITPGETQGGKMHATLLVKNVRPMGGETTNLLVDGDGIVDIAPALDSPMPDTAVVDGGGRLLVPGFVDGHAHIDKSLWGLPWHPHQAGPRLIDKIENERRLRREMGLSPAAQAARIVRQGISKGTTH